MGARFDVCVALVIDAEGGAAITDDPDDPGGLTKYGISKRAHPNIDIANLTRADAIDIYRRAYWDAARCGDLPSPLDYYVFDCAVNQNAGRAVRFLQIILRVPVDGVIGPVTLKMARNLDAGELGALYLAQRALHYASLPTFQKYGRGWMKRLFLVAANQPKGSA